MFTHNNNAVKIAILLAVLYGIVYAFMTPVSSLFLQEVQPIITVAVLNIGAGIGMTIFTQLTKKTQIVKTSQKLTRKEIPTLVGLVICCLLSVVFFMLSLTFVAADSVSLVNCFSIVATALIAFCFFKERISRRVGVAIVLITLGCITITAGDLESFIASPGFFFALAACLCWGITNNLFCKLSPANPYKILAIRGLGVGIIALILSLILGEGIPAFSSIIIMLLFGFVIYGLGNLFFILAGRKLGAALPAAIGGFTPFLAALLSLLIFQKTPTIGFIIALLLLVPGVYLAVSEGVIYQRAAASSISDIQNRTPHDIRNTLSALGYFTVGCCILAFFFSMLNQSNPDLLIEAYDPFIICCSFFLLFIGILLIILRNRDFNGIMFIITAATLALFVTIFDFDPMKITMGIFMLIIAGIILLSTEKKKYLMSTLYLFLGIFYILSALEPHVTLIVISLVLAILLFIMGVISFGQMPKLRLTKLLTANDSIDFRKSGAMIGYLFFAFSMFQWVLLYATGTSAISYIHQINITVICIIIQAIIGLLMIFVGKSWFTGGIFLGIAFTLSLTLTGNGPIFYVVGILLMVFGLLSVLRKPSYLLPALMYIIYGISAISSQSAAGVIQIPFAQLLLNIVPCAIAIYLAAAIFSRKKKLPLF